MKEIISKFCKVSFCPNQFQGEEPSHLAFPHLVQQALLPAVQMQNTISSTLVLLTLVA